MKLRLTVFLAVCFWCGISQSQVAPSSSDPQALAMLNNSITASGVAHGIESITITASLISYIPPGPEHGTAALSIDADGQTRSEFDLADRTEVETTGPRGETAGCQRTGSDGQLHDQSTQNCILSISKFLPTLTIAGQMDRLTCSLEAQADRPTLVIGSPSDASDEVLARLLNHLSTVELVVDPATNLPVSMSYFEHPEKDAKTDFPVEILYSDYQNFGGVMVPRSIKKFIFGGLVLELNVNNVSINSVGQ